MAVRSGNCNQAPKVPPSPERLLNLFSATPTPPHIYSIDLPAYLIMDILLEESAILNRFESDQ
jgi:hypothetical protein